MKSIKSIIAIVLIIILNSTNVFATTVPYGDEIQDMPNKNFQTNFSDVPETHWAYKYISEMVARGVINGYPDEMFRPDKIVNRDEIAKIIVNSAGLTAKKSNYSSFSDIKVSDWESPFVETAKDYLTGFRTADGQYVFNSKSPALREDITIAIVKIKGYDIRLADRTILEAMFKDYDGISEDALNYVSIAIENRLVSGYNDQTFRAQSPITRAEAVTMLWRAFQYGNDNKTNTSNTSNNITAPNSTATSQNTTYNSTVTNSTNNSNITNNTNNNTVVNSNAQNSNVSINNNTTNNNDNNTNSTIEVILNSEPEGSTAQSSDEFTVETLVGGITSAVIDGPVQKAAVKNIISMTMDNNNNLYFIDDGNIRKFNISTGNVETINYDSGIPVTIDGKSIELKYISARCLYFSNIDNKVYCLLSLSSTGSGYRVLLDVSDSNRFIAGISLYDSYSTSIYNSYISQTNEGKLYFNTVVDDNPQLFELEKLPSETSNKINEQGNANEKTWIDGLGLFQNNNKLYNISDNKLNEIQIFPRKITTYNILTGNITAVTNNNQNILVYDNNNFYMVSTTGKAEIYVKKQSLQYLDGNPFSAIKQMQLDKKGNIIFFDANSKSIRRINVPAAR